MIVYLCSVIVVASIWGAWWFLEWPLWIPITLTSVVVVGVVAWRVIKTIRARRASREIENALKAQAEHEARSSRPDRQAEIVALQGQFEEAVNALKTSRIGSRGAAQALYSLPWYVIVGRPGTGKSTALRNSGLNFPFRSSRGEVSVRGVGGTRNCEWWMTREAVILDTAGRYTSEGENRDEWFAFLDLLRRYRNRRPINGILATISAAELASNGVREAVTRAREIRARVDELQDRLGVVVPVYLIVTKCDLLPGFREMFGDLSDTERRQIWGFTLPARSQTNVLGQCLDKLDELVAVLEQRTLRRLIDEPRMEKRDKIYGFPQQLAGMRESLARFVEELTVEDAFHETPIVRGVYWSSGTQEGEPRDQTMSEVASSFGSRASERASAVPAKSYFLGDLFSRVVFPDHHLAGRSRERTRKQRIWVNGFGALGIAIAMAFVWLPLMAFRDNRELIAEGELGIAYVEQHVAEDSVDAIALDRLTTLRELLETLAVHRDEGPPWAMKMGMYQGEVIFPHLRDVYAATVRSELLLPLVERDLAAMEKFVLDYGVSGEAPTDEEYDRHFDRLRLYLLATGPSVEGEPGLSEDERSWMARYLGKRWTKPLRGSGDPATVSSMEAVAHAYIAVLADQPMLAFERDDNLVEQTRRILQRSDRTKSVARALVQSVQGRTLKITDMVGAPSIGNGGLGIRPAFTRSGHEGQIKPKLEAGLDEFLEAQWVIGHFGDEADVLRSEELTAVETEYYRLYILEWSTFIQAIETRVPEDYIGAVSMLSELTRGEPYKDLFSHIAYHTQLVDLDTAIEGESSDRLLEEAARIGGRRARQKLKVGRVVNPRLARMASESAAKRVMEGGDGAAVLLLSDLDVTYAFKGLVDFGARKAPSVPSAAGAPPPPPQAVPIDDYQLQLAVLRTALQRRLDDPSETESLVKDTKAAQASVKTVLSQTEETGWAPTLERILWPPIDLVWSLTEKGVADDLVSKWCTDVSDVFARNLAGRYPFRKEGADVPLADFVGYFDPEKGSIWQFYDAVLGNALTQRGDRFVLVETGSRSLGHFKPGVANYLSAVNEVTLSSFTRDLEVGVDFEVLLEGAPRVKEVLLTIDGQVVRHRNGPEVWTPLTWPGEGNAGGSLEARGFGIDAKVEREGEWGLFRLIEEGKVRISPDRRTFAVQWDLSDESAGLIQIRFRPKTGTAPFFGVQGSRAFLGVFRNKALRVPRSIMVDGPKCGGK